MISFALEMARTPPPEFPVRTYPVPVIADQVVVEWITSELASSSPLEPGSPHPNTRDFAGFKLGLQRVNPVDYNFTERVWVKDATAEDTYNYAIKYSGDHVSFPIFVHSYREPKLNFTARARGSALQVVYKLAVTNAGSGYVYGTQPALTFTGGAGSGAAGHGIVSPDGTIAEFVLTSTGTGYTSAPTFTVEASGGTTATGTASIQPTGAILVSEDVQQFPSDSEFFAQYFNVIRVYETLPGPLIPFTRYDDNLGPIQGTRRAVVWANQAPSLTATSKTTYEAREGSYYVAWELIETNSNGTGSAGNPAFPIFTEDIHDNDKGEVQRVTQVVVATGSEASSSTVSGGVVTHIDYLKIDGDPFHLIKLVETWAVPRALAGKETNAVKQVATVTTTRKAPGSDATPTALKDVTVTNEGDGTVLQVEKDIPAVFDEDRRTIEIPDIAPEWARALLATTTKSLKTAATSISDPTLGTGDLSKTLERVDEFDIKTTTVNRDPASLPLTLLDKEVTREFGGAEVDIYKTLALAGTTTVDEGEAFLSSEITSLGNGEEVKQSRVRHAGAWPILTDDLYDDEMLIQYAQTRQVVPAGTPAPDAGTTATADLTIAGGIVTAVTVTDGGTGYLGAPTFSFEFLIENHYTVVVTSTDTDIQFPSAISGILRAGDKIAFVNPTGNLDSQGVFYIKSVNTGADTFKISTTNGGAALVPDVSGSFGIAIATQQKDKTDVFVRDSSVFGVGERWGFYLGGSLVYYYITAVVDAGHVRLASGLEDANIVFPYSLFAPYNTIPDLSDPPILAAVVTDGSVTSVTITNGGSSLPSDLKVIISNPVFAYHAEVVAIDKWRSQLITVIKNPPSNEFDAIISYVNKPYTFPGRLILGAPGYENPDYGSPFFTSLAAPYFVQKSTAELVQVTLRTWWIKNVTAPIIQVSEIITHSVQVVEYGIDPGCGDSACYGYRIARIDNVLHDSFFNGIGQFFPQSTPSYSEYMGTTGQFTLTGDITFTQNSTTVTGSGSAFTTELQEGASLGIFVGQWVVDSITSDTSLEMTTPWLAPTGTVTGVQAQNLFPGWIGTSRIIAASVVPAKERNLWKVQTESVIMR
jgi:hypothetical protein